MSSGTSEPGNRDQNDDSSARRDQPRQENARMPAVCGPAFASPENAAHDLSTELVRVLPRAEGELVRCRHILGDHYRCNWWGLHSTTGYDNPEMGGLVVTTHRVVRSQMVRARRTDKGLEIDPGSRQ
jgi:hypothetical protein